MDVTHPSSDATLVRFAGLLTMPPTFLAGYLAVDGHVEICVAHLLHSRPFSFFLPKIVFISGHEGC